MKFEAFDRHFRDLLDRIAKLEARDKTRDARMMEIANANLVVPDLRKSSGRSLEIGATIAESAGEALGEIPGVKALLGAVKEAAGAAKALHND